MEKERIDIHGLAFGGAGVGRLADGRVCFVPYTSPGDTVDAEIVRRKKSFCEGRLLSVVVASPSRTAPPCPVFGRCGGCQLQHLQYDAQLAAKEEIFASALQRGAGIPRSAVAPIQSSPAPFGYRSRIQLKLHHDGKRFHCGFFAPDSHFVVDCGGFCPISAEPVNRTLAHLVDILQSFPDPRKLPQVDIASGDGASVNLVFHYIGELPEAAGWFRQAADSLPAAAGVYVQRGRKSSMETVAGDGFLRYAMPAAEGRMLDLRFGAGCFSQVNLEQNREMVAQALAWADIGPGDGVLDLFCGNGNFSLPAAVAGGRVEGYEAYPPSISDARANAEANGITNVRFEAASCTDTLHALAEQGREFDVVILDPPRTGAVAEAPLIPRLRPRKIVYVSCDPPTLARDLRPILAAGYRVVAAKPFDMFPQTFHIESITVLERA